MRNIKILDCTLRDGGYVNDWQFGNTNIKKIVQALNEANIDFIECGFLRDDLTETRSDVSLYSDFSQAVNWIGADTLKKGKSYALMMLTEKYDICNLPERNQNYFNIIRLSFHKKDIQKAILYAKEIQRKGYELFLQPTATMRYKDEELIELFKICNEEIHPRSIAIVDTFGEMLPNDVIHYAKLFDQYLSSDIELTFHSHNNLQNAFCNTILFIQNISYTRNIVIDASIYGMGRGAGNLCLELIIDYLNKYEHTSYQLFPILDTIDNILVDIKKQKYWGYSLEYYLSATYHCHPNYCIYFSEKKALSTNDLQQLVHSIGENHKTDFDKEYADELYFTYFTRNCDDDASYKRLEKLIGNREILLLAPGKNLVEQSELLTPFLEERDKYFVISLNTPLKYPSDAYFISNRKRYQDMEWKNNCLYLFTSNIDDSHLTESQKIVFDYHSVLAQEYATSDNSLLMLLNLLKKFYRKTVYLAGFDGYEYNQTENYYQENLLYLIEKTKIDELNELLTKYISLYRKDLNIQFVTKSKYDISPKCLRRRKND